MRTWPWHGLCACTVALAAGCASAADEGIRLEPIEDGPSTSEGSIGDPPDTPGGLVADPDLAAAIPPVDGAVYVEADLPPHAEGMRLPPGTRALRRSVEIDGAAVGFVMVAGPPAGMDGESYEDLVVDAFFAAPVDVVQGEAPAGDGTVVATTSADPRWSALGEEFVMEAAVEGDPSARLQWFWDDLLWIVESQGDPRSFTEQVITAQHGASPPDDHDTSVIAGELLERFADVPDFTYIDLLRLDLTTHLPVAVAGTCADQWLPFGVAADPDDTTVDADNILVEMAVIGEGCPTFADDLRATLMGLPGAHDETIGGVPVLVSERNVAWIEDGIVFVATAESPDTIVGYRPFLDAFIQAQADMAPVG